MKGSKSAGWEEKGREGERGKDGGFDLFQLNLRVGLQSFAGKWQARLNHEPET